MRPYLKYALAFIFLKSVNAFPQQVICKVLNDDSILDIYQMHAAASKYGLVCCGTNGGGLFALQKNSSTWNVTSHTNNPLLVSNMINCITPDDSGTFWIGTLAGLSRVDSSLNWIGVSSLNSQL